MIHQLALVKEWLEAFHPALPWALLPIASYLVCLGIRKWMPTWWTALLQWGPPNGPLEKFVGSFPSVMGSALVAGFGTGDVLGALAGAGMGLLAPVFHHLRKALTGGGRLGAELTGPESRARLKAALIMPDPYDIPATDLDLDYDQVTVHINGIQKTVRSPSSYAELVTLDGYNPDRVLSVTLKSTRSGQGRIIRYGERDVHLFDGDKINVADTSAA